VPFACRHLHPGSGSAVSDSVMSPHDDWVSVGQYHDYVSAAVVSARLTDEGVPNRIWIPPQSAGESFIWVPPESADLAKRILAEPAVSEAELTALATKDPPPDDFETVGTEPGQRTALEPPTSHAFLLIVLLVSALAGALFVHVRKIPSHEIARQRSPDGRADAVLIGVPQDAAGAHSYKVCLQRAGALQLPASCGEVAYLSGVSSDTVSQAVGLVWTAPSQLEIRYRSATSVHIYQHVVAWGSTRYSTAPPIVIRVVHTGNAGGG
jgi:hypothetical protein